ncbi:MAG: lipid A export permease/ATP-binding protein MsbA [Neisseriaceae bacterium]|nr:lipid A export permease/ATP-binding protein MsbA [Neisseriaceae bacterium]
MKAKHPSLLQNSWYLYRRLWRYLSSYWGIFTIAIIAMLIVAATHTAFAYLIKPLIDEGFVDKNLKAMRWLPLAIVGLFVLRGVFNFINEYCTAYLSGHLVQSLREEMFAKLLRLPAHFYQNNASGRVISRILNDVGQVTDAGFNVITVVAKDGVTLIGLLLYLLYLDWRLTLVTLIAIPVVGVAIRLSNKRMRRLSRENQQHLGEMTQILGENVDGHKIVKIYGGQEYETKRFHQSALSVRHNLIKQTAANSANTAFTQLMIAIALSLIVYFAAMRAAKNTFGAGDFMSFLTAMIMMFDPIKRITTIMQTLQRGLAAAESAFGFLDIAEENDVGKLPLNHFSGSLKLENVFFRYPEAEKNALNNISLSIPSGKMIALVGSSGCGKSTLAHLLPRFYEVTEGVITIDGHDIRDYALSHLRHMMALVSQDIVLFNGTVAENVAYGECASSDTEKITAALKAAHAWDFVQALPQGIQTLIGEKGTKLSGGQRQRLAIARALLKNAPILILDEATSALDTESEKAVQAALDTLMQNRTTLVIAHRLSTIQNADQIVVMDEGRIIETGEHQELLQRGGRYAMLYNMQFHAS